ncbi:MAG TPA: pitrilysin family protein, partial [Limnochordales bacterium]
TQPAFAAGELERMRPRWVAQARQAFDDPGELAARYADHLLYGPGHPLGRLPDPGPAMAVRREDLVAFHARHYTPRGALLVVAGDVEPDRVLDLVRRHLGGWEGPSAQGGPPSPQGAAGLIPPARLEGSRVQFVEWPGQTQVRVELRQPGPPVTADDWLAVRVYNYILGGGAFASRLMDVMRVQLGSTYDVHSYYSGYRFGSHWVLSTYTRNDQVWKALEVLQAELARFYRDGITQQELEDARGFYVGSYPMRLETAADLAQAISDAIWQGRGLEWVSLFPVRAAQLRQEEVQAAIRRHFDPERFAVTLLGDPSVLQSAPARVWGVPAQQVQRVARPRGDG